jgi:hypothetical protein
LGIDVATQSYICWVIDTNQEKISAHLVFDEVTPLKKPSNLTLQVASESRNPKDFEYLVGMVYRDDEDHLLYVSSRIAVQQSYIVVYRKLYAHNVVGQEEPNPIHADDVERMLRVFLLDSQPLVVLPGDNSATKVGVLQPPSVDATMSDGAKSMSDGYP